MAAKSKKHAQVKKQKVNKFVILLIIIVGIFVATILAMSTQDIRNWAISTTPNCAKVRCMGEYKCRPTLSGGVCYKSPYSPPSRF